MFALVLFTALGVALIATPLVRRFALGVGVVDAPANHKAHARTMPLLGGVAIYVGVLVALFAQSEAFYARQAAGILLGATFMALLGVWDDVRPLRPLMKLAGQVVAAALLVAADVRVQLFDVAAFDIALTLFAVIGTTNAFNLLDNTDGLSAGVAAVAAGALLALAVLNGQFLVGALAAALLGACLGFLMYNFNPASIFMGDAGSLFIGFIIAAAAIKLRFIGIPTSTSWCVPIMALGVPIFDTTLVVFSRLRRGVPVSRGGKDHLAHRLVARGWSTRRAVLVHYGVAAACGGVAVLLTLVPQAVAYACFGLAVAVGACALVLLDRGFTPRARPTGALPADAA